MQIYTNRANENEKLCYIWDCITKLIPMYSYKEDGGRFLLSIDNHTEISQALKTFCGEKGIKAGTVYGIGAVCEATFRFLNPATKQYVDKTFSEQMEIINLTGNISTLDGNVYLHLHAVAGRRDYTCVGGHLLTATVNGACELAVEAFGCDAPRIFDPETGLNLYNFQITR